MATDPIDLSAEILEELNGSVFLHNESGETEEDTKQYYVLIDTNFIGANDTHFFCQDPVKGTGNPMDPIALNQDESKDFLTDNFIWLRHVCGLPLGAYTNDQLYELV